MLGLDALHRGFTEVVTQARTDLERAQVGGQVLVGTSTSGDLRAGGIVSINDTGGRFSGAYVVTAARHLMKVEDNGCVLFGNEFTGIPVSQPYRPAREHPKPTLAGTVSAFVVSAPGEEFMVDNTGRVKVRFPWLPANTLTQGWVRFAVPLASRNRGFQHVPAAGDEVLVAFEGGDPDRPIIVGSVWNTQNMPPLELPQNKDVLLWAQSADVRITQRSDGLTFSP
jgi:type VI secretion system secreted protein VgrG